MITVKGGGTCVGLIGPNRFVAEPKDSVAGRAKVVIGTFGLILLTAVGVSCAILFKTSAASIF